MTEHLIVLIGAVPSKKNEKTPFKNKAGKMRFYNPSQAAIDRLSMQVPATVRDLGLLHPDIEFTFTVPHGGMDTDNTVTTLMDILVTMGVLQNDSVARNNGRKTINPAVRGDVARTTIKLTDTGIDRWPKITASCKTK